MASWHRVLHLCAALKINLKQRTELETENSGGIFFRQPDELILKLDNHIAERHENLNEYMLN